MFNERESTERKNRDIKKALWFLSQDYQTRDFVAKYIQNFEYDRVNFDIHDVEEMFLKLREKLDNE